MKKIKWKEIITDLGYLLFGSILFGLAYTMFFLPGGIYVGGASGIASALYNSGLVTFLPVGTMIILINVPLMALFTYFYGIKSSFKGIIGVLVSSAFIDFLDGMHIFPPGVQNPEENGLLCAILGAIVLGTGLGLLFNRGFTTGGSDIMGLLLNLAFRRLTPSKLIFVSDIGIILFAAIATDNYMSILYSAVAIYIFTTVLDIVTSGFEKARLAFIFSEHYAQIADEVMQSLHHAVTVLDGKGWYTKKGEQILLCVVKKSEIFALKTIVRHIDPDAFVIMGEVTQAIGKGFSQTGETLPFSPRKRDSFEKTAKAKSSGTGQVMENDSPDEPKGR